MATRTAFILQSVPPLPEDSPARSPHAFQRRLAQMNAIRLSPALPDSAWRAALRDTLALQMEEGEFLERERSAICDRAARAPRDAASFLRWFEDLLATGPGQGDALFPWLAREAQLPEIRWFLTQEAAGEAGFDDLVALTQIRFPTRPKLEMARNYWDEMGRGHERGMHGPLLARLVDHLDLRPTLAGTVWESLALANLMVGLAANRRFAYHAVGALGVVEMTAPGRVTHVNQGLKRLGVDADFRTYFALHAGLDVQHSRTWNQEVLAPLVEANPAIATAVAEGALMRLHSGARCYQRYRAHFGF